MRKRDFLKKKAERTKDQSSWANFKTARIEVNNSIKYAKRKYFSDNLAASRKDPRKTWQLIDLIYDISHLWGRLRVAGKILRSRGHSGGKQLDSR